MRSWWVCRRSGGAGFARTTAYPGLTAGRAGTLGGQTIELPDPAQDRLRGEQVQPRHVRRQPFRTRHRGRDGHDMRVAREHRRLVEYIRQRDAAKGEALILKHMNRARNYWTNVLGVKPPRAE